MRPMALALSSVSASQKARCVMKLSRLHIACECDAKEKNKRKAWFRLGLAIGIRHWNTYGNTFVCI